MSTTNCLSRLSIHLRVVFAFALLMATSSWADLDPISYIDEIGDEKFLEPGSYTLLDTLLGGEYGQPGDNGVISLPGGWYVVSNDMSTDNPVDFAGDVQLVILDGVTVFVTNDNAANKFTGAGNFTVYGQKDGSGELNIDVFDVRKTLTVNNIHLSSNTRIKSSDSYFVFNGGSLNAYFVDGKNKLRWNKGTDFVLVGTFDNYCSSSTAIDENTPFVDEDGNLYRGYYGNSVSSLNGNMLKPAFAIDVDYQDGRKPETFVATFDEKSNAFFVKEPPSEPTLDDAKFLGWSTTATGEINEFDWKEPVKQNTKVYARWELKPIKYVDENGEQQTITQYIGFSSVLKMSNGGTMFIPGGWYVLDGKIEELFDIVFNDEAHIVLEDNADIKLGSINAYGDISFYAGVALNNEDNPVVGSGVLNFKNIILLKNADFNGGQLKCSKIHARSESLIAINGGVIEAEELVYANLSLGWHNVGGLITVNKYTKRNENSELSIADGKYFKDEEGNVYSGTIELDQNGGTVLDGKTLIPTLSLGDENIVVADIPVQAYTGYSICPEVVVKDGKKTLEVKKDYTVECFENVEKSSTAPYAKITGMGIYGGEIEKHFAILDKSADYAAVGIFKDEDGHSIASIDGNYGEDGSVNIDEEITVDSVIFERSFLKNTRSTIVLPFSVSTSQIKGLKEVLAFGKIVDKKTVEMNAIWDNTSSEHVTLNAYTPYIVLMDGEKLDISGAVTLEVTRDAVDAGIEENSEWEFRGSLSYKKWEEDDPELGSVYGFAASSDNDLGVEAGDFVRVAAGAWINPMRAYLVKKPSPTGLPKYNADDLPDNMSIVIVKGDKNVEVERTTVVGEHTTVIGKTNTLAGKLRLNYEGKRTFDIKGRNVGTPKAKGMYLKK